MPPKNSSNAGQTGETAEQVKLYRGRLLRPARIDGVKSETGDIVEVDALVAKQLAQAEAIEPIDLVDTGSKEKA